MSSLLEGPVAQRMSWPPRWSDTCKLFARLKTKWETLRAPSGTPSGTSPRQERNKSRESALADVIEHLVWWSTSDGAALSFNRRWLEYTGLPATEPVVPWPHLLHPDDLDETLKRWNQCLLSRTTFEVKSRLRRHDGEYRWHKVLAALHVSAECKKEEWIGTCIDIHDHTLQIEKTRHAEASLQHALCTRDEFLATLSHELRTPMNVILGWVQILRTEETPTIDMRHVLEIIDRNARSQVQLINDLLDVSRIIGGKMLILERLADMESITLAGLEPFRLAARQKSILVETHFDSGLKPLRGDPDRLQQVVWNLVSNAVKFTPRGGSLVIALRRRASHVVLEVQDTGQGIDADFLPFVFQSFRQEDGSPSRRLGGLGLGLSIAKHIVEMHGGTLTAQSQGRGMGALFVVSLPLRARARGPRLQLVPAPVASIGAPTRHP